MTILQGGQDKVPYDHVQEICIRSAVKSIDVCNRPLLAGLSLTTNNRSQAIMVRGKGKILKHFCSSNLLYEQSDLHVC